MDNDIFGYVHKTQTKKEKFRHNRSGTFAKVLSGSNYQDLKERKVSGCSSDRRSG